MSSRKLMWVMVPLIPVLLVATVVMMVALLKDVISEAPAAVGTVAAQVHNAYVGAAK
jgi:hypothetical protein